MVYQHSSSSGNLNNNSNNNNKSNNSTQLNTNISFTRTSSMSSSTLTQMLCAFPLLVGALLLLAHMPCGAEAVPLFPGGINIEYKHYCSNSLSDAVDLICGGRTNSLARRFPDSVGASGFRALKRFAPSSSDDGVFFRPIHTGPIHECCRRPCGYSELKMYCAN